MDMPSRTVRRWKFGVLTLALVILSAWPRGHAQTARRSEVAGFETRTPIKHLVVIFDENRPFDHYFGTYPIALNLPGEVPFHPKPHTPAVENYRKRPELLLNNPNYYLDPVTHEKVHVNPFRLGRDRVVQCSQNHGYMNEQQAVDGGLMDQFIPFNKAVPPQAGFPQCDPTIVMSYYDGNTVTALWTYAQLFAMSDNHFASNWGSSTVGAINLASGQTHGAVVAPGSPDPVGKGDTILDPGDGLHTVIGNSRPALDDCSLSAPTGSASNSLVTMVGRNIGDLLNDKSVTWGWFNGGFRPTGVDANGRVVCGAAHPGSNGVTQPDYFPHHQPFQYYASTANPHHLPPTSAAAVGRTDQANHQYDFALDFWAAAESGHLPAVTFVKAAAALEGHARYSDPLREQQHLVETINRLQRLHEWKDMAIVIAYDDSDGLYDHVQPPLVNASNTAKDALTGPGACGASRPGADQGRCGYGPRLPFLVISPYAKRNFVDHTLTDQSSIIRFIEDNWGLPRVADQSFDERAGTIENLFDFSRKRPGRVFLDPVTGRRLDDDPDHD
jgi:phospholipase C